MNQIVHIFRKDCRRLWQIIAAVLVFTFLHGYGGATIFAGSGMAVGISPYLIVLILASLSGLILPVLFFLLVVSVIQEERLVGSDTFWLTRPYDRVSLFLEKFLFVVLWAFLPMLLHDVFLIRHFGFSLFSAFGLLLWKSAQFGFFLLVAATAAVLSASFARAVLIAIGAILITLFTQLTALQIPGEVLLGTTTATYFLSILSLAALGALSVIVFQYRFRITSVAALIAVTAIVACALLAHFWPPSLTTSLSNRYASPWVKPVQLVPDASLTGLTRPPALEPAENQARSFYYPFRAVGLPSDVGITVNSGSAKFAPTGQDQTIFYVAQQARFQPATFSRLFADAIGPDQLVPFMVAHPDNPEPLKHKDGALSGKLYFDGFRASVARVPVPLPIKPQKFAIAGRRCSVAAGQREGKLILRFDCIELEPGNTSRFQVHLLQDGQEIIPQGTSGQSSSQGGWPAFLSPILWTDVSFEFSPQVSADILASGSPKGREMLIFDEEFLGREERSFRIDHFRPAELSLQAWEQRGLLLAPE